MGAPHNSMLKALAAVAFFTPLFLKMEQSRQVKKKLEKNPNFMNVGQQAQFKQSVRNDLFFYGIGGALVSGLGKNFIGSGMSSLTYYIMNNINKPAAGPTPDTEIEKSARDYLSRKTAAEIALSPELQKTQKMLADKGSLDTEIEKEVRAYLSTKTAAEIAASPRLKATQKMLADKDVLNAAKKPENGMLAALKKHILV